MKKILLFFFCFPLFCFASFPVQEDFQLIDTVIINGKIYIGTGVDSTSNYPLEKETLSEYRERLKNQNINPVNAKKSIDWTRIIIIWLVLGLILSLLVSIAFLNTLSSSSWW
tara:strand:- start:7 stop:342 length:336 start_codon:yes stop_codon:yes gene_type:complete